MQLSKQDIKDYPKFARYVSLSMPEVANVSVIVSKIKELAGTITTEKIKESLVWGKGPMVTVADLPDDTNGEFTPDIKSNEIRINRKRVKQFEDGKGLEKTKWGKLVYVVGTILLHELTHWADDQDGVDTAGEEGKMFEEAIYGKDMGNEPF
jgi:Metallopeptidase toxin 3